MRLANRYGAWVIGLAVVLCAAALGGAGRAAPDATFPGGAITFADCCSNIGALTGASSAASPYSSDIDTTASFAATTTVADVNVTVTLDHPYPDDVDLLLVSPDNLKVLLMSDVGNDAGNAITPDVLTFDDAAAGGVPATGQLESGTYDPTDAPGDCDNQSDGDAFPAAPAGPYPTTLATLNNSHARGVWKLYAVDDCNVGNVPSAAITSWSLDIAPNLPTNVTLTNFSVKRAKQGAVATWKTAVENQLLGFNVYRVAGKKSVKLNKRVIPAKAALTGRGASYKLTDKAAKKNTAYTYRLQSIGLDAKKTWLRNATLKRR